MVQQVICQLHCIWKNTNSCEFMGAHARSSAHGCPWMYMVVHACVWVFMCFCLFVVLFCFHPLSLNLKEWTWDGGPSPGLISFLNYRQSKGFEGAFFEISSGSSSFIKTNCQDWMAFHLSKAVVGKKNEEKSWWGLVVFIFFAKTKRPIQPRLDQSLKGLQPSISENQHKD